MKFTILPTFNPVFREKRTDPSEKIETFFSDEIENDNGIGARKIGLINQDNKELVGNISFDYDFDDHSKMIRVRSVGVDHRYQRHDLAMKLYRRLIDIAKEKELDGIKSDTTVQGGAIASWKKLKEEGYDLSVLPELQEKFDAFCQAYNEGKYFKELLTSPAGYSVFNIKFKR